MPRLCLASFVLGLALLAGCKDSKDAKPGDPSKPAPGRSYVNIENFHKIQPNVMDFATVNALLGGKAKRTNETPPGLLGDVFV